MSTENFKGVDGFVAQIKDVSAMRSKVTDGIHGDGRKALVNMGFPSQLIPIMEKWAETAPDLIGSYAHPEKPLCFYPTVACLRLAQTLDELKKDKINLNAKTIFYDTVDLIPAATVPLKINLKGEGFGMEWDAFGVGQSASLGIVHKDFLIEKLEKFEKKRMSTQSLAGDFRGMLDDTAKKTLSRTLKEGHEMLSAIFGEIVVNKIVDTQTSVNHFMALMQWRMIIAICDIPPKYINLESSLGISSSIYSHDKEYLALVKSCLGDMAAVYGPEIFKKIVKPGSNEVLAESNNAKLRVNSEEKFTISGNPISDGEAIDMIMLNSCIPLSRLENLVLYGLGTTFHFGSEYGARPATLEALGISGQALNYALSLQIGKDKSQGEIVVPGLSSFFGYLLFGNKLESLILTAAKTGSPQVTTVNTLKALVVENLT